MNPFDLNIPADSSTSNLRAKYEKIIKNIPNNEQKELTKRYLRVLGQSTYKQALQFTGNDLHVVMGKLQIIQKLLDVLSDNDEESCLVQARSR